MNYLTEFYQDIDLVLVVYMFRTQIVFWGSCKKRVKTGNAIKKNDIQTNNNVFWVTWCDEKQITLHLSKNIRIL